MKRYLIITVAVLVALAIALPAFALEFKYGGLYRLRWHSSDNMSGLPSTDDNQNYMDQRLRMFFNFVSSENLQLVTKWEVDTLWGNSFDKYSTGGGVGADSINLEMKNVYAEFNIPNIPVRSAVGVQGIAMQNGWIIDDDFSGAKFTTKLDPVNITFGYIAALNNNVTSSQANTDDLFGVVEYAQGPFKAGFNALWQAGHSTNLSTFYQMSTGTTTAGVPTARTFRPIYANPTLDAASQAAFRAGLNGVINAPTVEDNQFVDLGVNLQYKMDWFSAYFNYVQNIGSYDAFVTPTSTNGVDYQGYMVEAYGNGYFGPFTFTLGGFLASGDNQDFNASTGSSGDGNFRYPRGASHYWSEILGLGTLDQSVSGSYLNPVRYKTDVAVVQDPVTGKVVSAKLVPDPKTVSTPDHLSDSAHGSYMAADVPSNLWTINAGFAYQALEKTKLTFNYYYVGTQRKVLADYVSNDTSAIIGNEFNVYIDQNIVDKLDLRLVGAYLVAGNGLTVFENDLDQFEAGARLQWGF